MKAKSVSFLLFVALCCLIPAAALAASDAPLDGKKFVGQLTDESDKSKMDDTFVFTDGTFRSTACDEFGYGPGKYHAKPNGKSVSFDATTTNKSGDTITWKGTVEGDSIKGTSVRKTAKGGTFNSTFEGHSQG